MPTRSEGLSSELSTRPGTGRKMVCSVHGNSEIRHDGG